MSLLLAPNEDLVDLSRFYSKLVSKTNGDRSLRAFYIGRMKIYTKELKSRGIDWKKRKKGKE